MRSYCLYPEFSDCWAHPPRFKFGFAKGFLTVITLGIFRFWAKVRLREYIWPPVSVDNDGFEYTGAVLEKLLGFSLTIMVLAICLGTVQLIPASIGLGMVSQSGNEPTTIVLI